MYDFVCDGRESVAEYALLEVRAGGRTLDGMLDVGIDDR